MSANSSQWDVNSSAATPYILPQHVVLAINEKTAMKLIVPTLYVAIMMTVGVFGNCLVIYIYGCRWHRSTTKIFVCSLAVFDLVNCFITMPTEIVLLRNFYYLDTPVYCKISRFSTFWMNNNSAIVLLIIAVDRFRKICTPNRVSFSYRGAKIACVLAVLGGVLVSWPGLFIYGKQTSLIPTSRGYLRIVMCNVDDAVKDTWYPKGYYIYLWIAFLAIAVVLIILYALIGAQIWIRKIKRDKRTDSYKSSSFKFSTQERKPIYKGPVDKKVSSKESDDTNCTDLEDDVFKNTDCNEDSRSLRRPRLPTIASIKFTKHGLQAGRATLMLALITLVYVISYLPFLVITMIRTVRGDNWYSQLSDNEQVVVNLFLRSYLVSNTVNPIIYGCCNVQFRQEYVRLVKRLTCRKK